MEFEFEKLDKIYRRSLDQFKDKPKMQALLASYGIQYQELEVMFAQLLVLRDVDQAIGDALYKLGDTVGEPWKGQSTEEYRLAIKARIHANSLHSRAEDILSLFTDHHMIDRKMKSSLRSRIAQTYAEAYTAWVYLQRIKGGAHGGDYQYAGVEGSQHYQLDSNSKGSLFNTTDIIPPSDNEFCCAVAQGRYIWFIPKESSYWLRLDVTTDTYVTYDKGFVGSLAFAVYDGTAYIWGVPDNSAYFVRISILDGSVTTIAHGLTPEPQMFSHATLDDSGDYIIAAPYNADYIVRITVADDSLSTISYGAGNYAKFKYCLAGPAYVYCIPYNAGHIIRLDPNPFAGNNFPHGESGSALWQKAVIYGTKIFLSPHTAGRFLYANLDLSSIVKPTWDDKDTNDTIVDCFLYQNRLIHVPGKHNFWIEQDTTSGAIKDKFRHTLPEETDCAKRAVQHEDGSITGYGSIIDPYIIKFNPELNQSRHAKAPLQANGNFLNSVGSVNNNSNSLYWGPEGEGSIVKIDWQGSYGGIATQIVRERGENILVDGDCERADTDAWLCLGTTLTKSTTTVKEGIRSLKILLTDSLQYNLLNDSVIEIGEKYSFSCWLYGSTTQYVDIKTGPTTVYTKAIQPNIWNYVKCSFVSTFTYIIISMNLSGIANWYFDAGFLKKVTRNHNLFTE